MYIKDLKRRSNSIPTTSMESVAELNKEDTRFGGVESRHDFLSFIQYFKMRNILSHKRELNILKLLISGLNSREIDEHLGLKKGVSMYFIRKLRVSYKNFIKDN